MNHDGRFKQIWQGDSGEQYKRNRSSYWHVMTRALRNGEYIGAGTGTE